jgi:hypothetical protein
MFHKMNNEFFQKASSVHVQFFNLIRNVYAIYVYIYCIVELLIFFKYCFPVLVYVPYFHIELFNLLILLV